MTIYAIVSYFLKNGLFMKTVISFNGKTPNEQEHKQLLTQDLLIKHPSFVKRNKKTMAGLLCFLAGIGCIILSLYLTFGTKATFGIFRPWNILRLPCVVLGFTLLCMGIDCFRSRPAKPNLTKPQYVLHQHVKKCLIDPNYFYIGTIDTVNSYATLQRMLPEMQEVDYKTFTTYLETLHSKMLSTLKDNAKSLNLPEYNFKASSVNTSLISKKTVSLGIERLTMDVNLCVKNTQLVHATWRNKFIPTRVFHLKLIFNMTLVQLGKCWFVYDPLPDYEINKPGLR